MVLWNESVAGQVTSVLQTALMWSLHQASLTAGISEKVLNKIPRYIVHIQTDTLCFLLPLGILALKCSHNGWSYGANLWWLFVLWPTNRKWILLWHVPRGRVGFVLFYFRSRGMAVTAKCMFAASSWIKVICTTADYFVLCHVSHPQASALQLDQKW